MTTIVVAGEVDLATADRLSLPLRPGRRLAPVVHLDLRGVTFMDLSGLRVLLLATRRATAANGHLGLTRVSPQVRRLLQITGVETTRQDGCGCLRLVEGPPRAARAGSVGQSATGALPRPTRR